MNSTNRLGTKKRSQGNNFNFVSTAFKLQFWIAVLTVPANGTVYHTRNFPGYVLREGYCAADQILKHGGVFQIKECIQKCTSAEECIGLNFNTTTGLCETFMSSCNDSTLTKSADWIVYDRLENGTKCPSYLTNRYGYNCRFECHCDPCDRITGLCQTADDRSRCGKKPGCLDFDRNHAFYKRQDTCDKKYTISCRGQSRIDILKGLFGRRGPHACLGLGIANNCGDEGRSTSMLKKKCNNRTSCTIMATKSFFQYDACRLNFHAYFPYLEWRCSGACPTCEEIHARISLVGCSNWRFGVDCQKECHCADVNEDCFSLTKLKQDEVAGSCETGCANNFAGPACQGCQIGRYGPHCEFLCHCAIGKPQLCNKTTGSCENGCRKGFAGLDCYTPLPRLLRPPILEALDKSHIKVTWNDFIENDMKCCQGRGPIMGYKLNYDVWQKGEKIISLAATSRNSHDLLILPNHTDAKRDPIKVTIQVIFEDEVSIGAVSPASYLNFGNMTTTLFYTTTSQPSTKPPQLPSQQEHKIEGDQRMGPQPVQGWLIALVVLMFLLAFAAAVLLAAFFIYWRRRRQQRAAKVSAYDFYNWMFSRQLLVEEESDRVSTASQQQDIAEQNRHNETRDTHNNNGNEPVNSRQQTTGLHIVPPENGTVWETQLPAVEYFCENNTTTNNAVKNVFIPEKTLHEEQNKADYSEIDESPNKRNENIYTNVDSTERKPTSTSSDGYENLPESADDKPATISANLTMVQTNHE